MRVNTSNGSFDSTAQPGDEGQVAPLRHRAAKLLTHVFNTGCLVLLGLGFYFLISNYLLQSVRVLGSSMAPTLHDSESYLLNRWIYHFRAPQRQEVVVLRDPLDGGFSVKRVIAIGGDLVEIKSGVLYVNGREMREPYLPPMTFTFGEKRDETFRCRENEYFVLGDNRNNSVDSRRYGPVGRQSIMGMIIR